MGAFILNMKPQVVGDTWEITFQITDANGNPASLPDGPYTGSFILETYPGGLAFFTGTTSDMIAITASTGAIVVTVPKTTTVALDGLTYPYPLYKLILVDNAGIQSTPFEGILPLQL